jgi:YEATS domain-containing protein 4
MSNLRLSNKRLKGVTKHVPIVIGSIALWQGKKADENHTHKWSCYVRGVNNEEDISYFVKKVVFQLHPSFPQPVMTVEKFPFEIHQTGWGEFDIGIKIYFVDPAERAAEVIHGLKLHPEQNQQASMKKPVVSERYDEIVFVEPTESFAYILDKGSKLV